MNSNYNKIRTLTAVELSLTPDYNSHTLFAIKWGLKLELSGKPLVWSLSLSSGSIYHHLNNKFPNSN
jgi:hypothetical protein